jgi:DNA modification methylase
MTAEPLQQTTHRIHVADARNLAALGDDSVDLVITSPPYPMVEMWDTLFADLAPEVESYLDAGKGEAAFEAMHGVLDSVWDELERVVTPGGIICINVGDATRTVGGGFRVYPNHSRITAAFERRGFDPLPDILWHKPTNSAAKFMGSGMLPPSAYVTLEHEHILVFRNGTRREFEAGADRRYEAAYFWEERNRWFTDVWADIRGRLQDLEDDDLRDRAAAFPFEIPYRLCSMFSVYGDTVFDPFWGTGTTTLAAMVAGRHSVGYERDPAFLSHFTDRVGTVPEISREVVAERLTDHLDFVADRGPSDTNPDYESEYYGFPVMTSQEETLRLYVVAELFEDSSTNSLAEYTLDHLPADETLLTDRLGSE